MQREDREEGSAWARDLESAAKKGGNQREVRRTFGILREVWLNIGVEKIDMHEGIMIKALLDSGAMGMFMDRKTTAKHRFKLQKLERAIAVRNVDSTNNSSVTNFIWSYLHQFFDDSHSIKHSLKPLERPFN